MAALANVNRRNLVNVCTKHYDTFNLNVTDNNQVAVATDSR
jgi:hypothetical protein